MTHLLHRVVQRLVVASGRDQTGIAGGELRAEAPGGLQISNGEYLTALQQGQASVPADPGALATNHCVAYAMTEQLAQAQQACDSAVQAAQMELAQLPSWNPRSHTQAASSQAVAYSRVRVVSI